MSRLRSRRMGFRRSGMVAEVRPPKVIGVGAYAAFVDCAAPVSLAVDCAEAVRECATYASLICTESVPVRFEK